MKNKALRVIFVMFLASSFTVVSDDANATIYKCVDTEGKTYYNDKSCPKSENQTQLKNIKDPIGGYIPPAFKIDNEVKASNGVLVGKVAGRGINKSSSNDDNEAKVNSNSNSSSSSDSSDNVGTDSDEGIIKKTQSGNDIRRKKTGARKKPLPTIPLKVEKITREPRTYVD